MPTLEEVAGLLHIILERQNKLLELAEQNNKALQQSRTGFYSRSDLKDLFYIGPKTLKYLIKEKKINEYFIDGIKLYKAEEIFATIEILKKEKSDEHS